MRRTQAEWQSLIQEQQRSGQSAIAFCAERGINPKYFSLCKSRLQSPPRTKPKSENFVRLSSPLSAAAIQLSIGEVKLSIPGSYPVGALAELIRALSK